MMRDQLLRLPKAELHCHLDGSLRPGTMVELAREHSVALPSLRARELADFMHVKEARDLVDYLARFDITVSLMQTEPALERIAFELVEDCARENVRYLEVRFAPVLNTKGGLSAECVLEAVLRGLARGQRAYGTQSAVIVCALRHLDPSESVKAAQLALDFRNAGVVAFDLAGPEHGHRPADHRAAFDLAAEGNLAITVHAGEAYGPASIHEAIHVCHARRIGHGTRLHEDPGLMAYVNDFRIPLEICLTSNVQTRVAADYASHPFRTYYDAGLLVTLNTDNRLMSGTTVTDEYLHAQQQLGLDMDAMAEIALMGFEAAFLPHAAKVEMLDAVASEIETILADASAPHAL